MRYVIVLICSLILFSCRENNIEIAFINRKDVPKINNTERLWDQGWLNVPENRKSKSSNIIELPFILSKVSDSLKTDAIPVLIMSGGPGNSSLHMANGSVYTAWGKVRDLIVLEQRGTRYSTPALNCPEIDSLRINGLKRGLYGEQLDSLVLRGTELCYQNLISKNIDLNGYNTLESIEDIEALRKNLKIEKLILYGMSYSCNLMATYAQQYPQNVKALILDSPLPHDSNYDEEVYENMDRILQKVLIHYGGKADLYDKWKAYLDTVSDSIFEISIDSITYRYTKNELIDIPINNMSSHGSLKNTVESCERIMNGDHSEMADIMSYYLGKSGQALGMRFSVWISEELPEEDPRTIAENQNNYSWLRDYAVNNVSFETKTIWPVASIYDKWKWPAGKYKGPVLILSGEFDPWTPEWYGKKLMKYFPNANHSIYSENSHLPGFTQKGTNDIADYLASILE